MVTAHLDALRALLAAASPKLDRGIATECKHFFSGAAAYVNGRIFMTLTSVGLALKLPPESQAELTRHGATPLRYFPQGPIKKDYVVVPEKIARDADALAPWVATSVRFALAVPKARGTTRVRGRSTR
jgi:TfoX/Sxy family transcriptional regulator of competence genes